LAVRGVERSAMTTFVDRPVPEWFAKPQLGIFVHWTMASVPAFAPLSDDPFTLAEQHGWEYAMAHSPYVEWYENSLGIAGSPVAEFHKEQYGDRPYAAFADDWRAAMVDWNAKTWAESFKDAGATYVVLVTKHHDGFCLWPSEVEHPTRANWKSERDLVGELANAVRAAGMRFGVYYSGGLDWTFVGPDTGSPITSFEAMIATIPTSDEYLTYATAHWHELIDRYQPDVLWNDIHWPIDGTPLYEYFYEQRPEGVVNDRFDMRGVAKGTAHADFVTPEYRSRPGGDNPKKFEVCRGIGRSFGYNAWETEADYLSVPALLQLHDDILAAGGNLLLNVGPKANGDIPVEQLDRLRALGVHRRAS
jgi:alpha-L-fucosidase